jgi:hypothetical protein
MNPQEVVFTRIKTRIRPMFATMGEVGPTDTTIEWKCSKELSQPQPKIPGAVTILAGVPRGPSSWEAHGKQGP